jgi:UDP-N-acetylmuramoyl-L-alanyl-D-glutamate--2,6-diaminopimelate ligase
MDAMRVVSVRGAPLFHSWGPDRVRLAPDVAGVTADSRRVRPGYVFVALAGRRRDGRQYVREALARGAVGVVTGPGSDVPAARVTQVANPRLVYGHLAAAARGYPSDRLTVLAVTGTNGKTSTVELAAALLRRAGITVRTIGTLTPPRETGGLTTPVAEDLQRLLQRALQDGVQVVLLEASSHGIVQHRLAGTRIAWAVVTHLGRDHLDYHGTVARYWAAKRRLVKRPVAPAFPHPELGVLLSQQVVEAAPDFLKHVGAPARVYGGPDGLTQVTVARSSARGVAVRIAFEGREQGAALLPWPTDALVPSLEGALAIARALGIPVDTLMAALPTLLLPPGRMNVYRVPRGPYVVIDYAHNPPALQHVLESVRRRWPRARVTAVFGGRGHRDPGKLAVMGQIAARLADRVIVTTDSPYDEDPAALGAKILEGAPEGRWIADRRTAILSAVWGARAGDVVVVTGRGHEDQQWFGDRAVTTGSDGDWVARILAATPEHPVADPDANPARPRRLGSPS